MKYTVYGTWQDTIGLMLAGHFTRNTGYPVGGPFTAIGWITDKGVVGQAIFTDYTGPNIEIHIYAPGCFTRKNISAVYNYVFRQLGCERLTAKPYSTNKNLLRLLSRLGFEYEFTQQNFYKENGELIDAKVYKLTKDNLPKWIKLSASTKTAASN